MKFENKGKWVAQINESARKNETISKNQIDYINRALSLIRNPDNAYETIEFNIKPYIKNNNLKLSEVITAIDTQARKALGRAFRTKAYTDSDLKSEFVDIHKMKYESAQKNEAVTRSNYKTIIATLEDIIKNAAKTYKDAQLLKHYKATTGSNGVTYDLALHFNSQNDIDKAIKVSNEMKSAMKKYDYHEGHGSLNFVGDNNKQYIFFGSTGQGSTGCSVGYYVNADFDVRALESAQMNEALNKFVVSMELRSFVSDPKKVEMYVKKFLGNDFYVDKIEAKKA